jgi:ABC-2 type transport system permease protein
MTVVAVEHGLAQQRSARQGALTAFWAQLLRDVHVLRKTLRAFLLRTVMQPALTVFVFTYVFPKIGQGIGSGSGEGAVTADEFSTLLVPGVMATACIFQGIQAVALPLVQDFGFTREIDDRVLAPLPVWGVAVEKMVAGALQGVLAALVVFPLGAFIPATPVHLEMNWPLVLTIIPLATLLGAVYYPWDRLGAIPWLKWAVLINPLMYMSEGFRAALTKGVPHMALPYVYLAMIGCTALLSWAGIRGFRKRVIQ